MIDRPEGIDCPELQTERLIMEPITEAHAEPSS
jgi:hypothetical protein